MIRSISDDDILKRQKLYKECFPESLINETYRLDHYNWKFKNSNIKSWEYVLTDDNDNLLGYYAALTFTYYIEGEKYKVGMVCDVMTSVRARGQGVFTKIGSYGTQHLLQNINLLTGYPIRKEVIPGHLKVGWEIVKNLPLYIKPNILNIMRGRGVSNIKMIEKPHNFESRGYQISYYNSFSSFNSAWGDGYENFQTNSNSWSKFRLSRSKVFLSWRLGAPRRNYVIGVVSRSNELNAMFICTITMRFGYKCLGVLDIQVSESSKRISKAVRIGLRRLSKVNKTAFDLLMVDSISFKKIGLSFYEWLKTHKSFKWIVKTDDIILREKIHGLNPSLFWIDCDDL